MNQKSNNNGNILTSVILYFSILILTAILPASAETTNNFGPIADPTGFSLKSGSEFVSFGPIADPTGTHLGGDIKGDLNTQFGPIADPTGRR